MSFNETFHLHLKMLRLHGLKLNVAFRLKVFVLIWQAVTFLHSTFITDHFYWGKLNSKLISFIKTENFSGFSSSSPTFGF